MMTPIALPAVQTLLKTDVQSFIDMNTLLQNAEQYFEKAVNQQYLSPQNRAGSDFAGAVWMYACLIDAAVNDKDHNAAKFFLDKEWDAAVKWMKNELKKKKFLSGKPVYNVSKICVDAAASLRCLDTENCGSGIITWVRESGGSLTDLFESVHILDERLHKASEKVN